jgi:hypothetical protein
MDQEQQDIRTCLTMSRGQVEPSFQERPTDEEIDSITEIGTWQPVNERAERHCSLFSRPCLPSGVTNEEPAFPCCVAEP